MKANNTSYAQRIFKSEDQQSYLLGLMNFRIFLKTKETVLLSVLLVRMDIRIRRYI